jgi:enoyl-CoA hydratase/carnithine racemase
MQFDSYRDRYPNARLERREGVLCVHLHSDGGPLRFSIGLNGVHAQLGALFRDIARDTDNRVVILTGTGNVFCDTFDRSDVGPDAAVPPAFFDRMYREGQELLLALLDIGVPVIGAINGPALIHAELLVLADIVLAAEHAVIADSAHFPAGVVPGDGVQVVWPALLGPNRGRYFLLTGERLSATAARDLGVVAEIVPQASLLDRAWELALQMAKKPVLTLRHTRTVLNHHLRRKLLEELGYGLSLEFTASAAQRAGYTA